MRATTIAVVLACLIVAARSADAQTDLVPEDQAIVEIDALRGTTISFDGRDFGVQRTFIWRKLKGPIRPRVEATLPNGETVVRDLLVPGGTRTVVPLRQAGEGRLEIVAQTGHAFEVLSAAFSPDGQYVLIGCSDGAVRLWETASGNLLRSYDGHGQGVTAVAISPDGRYMLSGSDDHAAKLWDTTSGKLLRSFEGHTSSVLSVVFSPDGRYVLTASDDKSARLWEAASGMFLRAFEGHQGSIRSAAFSPDGRYVLTGSHDDSVRLWETANGELVQSFKEHGDDVEAVAISPDARYLLTGGWDNNTKLWEIDSGKLVRTFEGHDAVVESVAFSADGRNVLTGSADYTAVLWETTSGKLLRSFKGHDWIVYSVAFSPDGRYVLTGSSDSTARLWETASGELRRVFKGYGDNVKSVGFSPDGRYFLTGSGDGAARLWEPANRALQRTFEGHQGSVYSAAFSPEGRYALTGSLDGTAGLWEVANGKLLRTFEGGDARIRSVAFSPDGRYVLTGRGDATAELCETASGTPLHAFEGHTSWVQSVAFGSDGRYVVTGSLDNTAKLWETTSGKFLRTFKGHGHGVTSVGLSSDGRYVLTGGEDSTVKLWERTSGELLRIFEGHHGAYNLAAFSPDGLYVLSIGLDGTARLLETSNGKVLRSFEGHGTLGVQTAAFSPDGRFVLTGQNGASRLWDVATGDELVRLIALPEGDWLAVTPEGLFDGSEGGRKQVMARVGDGLQVEPIDRFYNSFAKPGLLAEIWSGKRPQPSISFDEVIKDLAPAIEIVSPKPPGETVDAETVDVIVKLIDKGGGHLEPYVRVNGSLQSVPVEKLAEDGSQVTYRLTVRLESGENRLTLQSANAGNSMDSDEARLIVTNEKELPRPNLYVLTVGVSNYASDALADSRGGADAEAMVELFEQNTGNLFGEVKAFAATDEQASAARIERLLTQTLPKIVRPQDVFVLHLTGHGLTVGETYYYLPSDFAHDQATLEKSVETHGISAARLGEWIAGIPATKRAMILDTVGSGAALSSIVKRRSAYGFDSAIQKLNRTTGVYVIAAAAATEDGREVEELGHGVLTYSLLAAAGQAKQGPLADRPIGGGDAILPIDRWFGYAAEKVPALCQSYLGRRQDLRIHVQGSSFPLLTLSPDARRQRTLSGEEIAGPASGRIAANAAPTVTRTSDAESASSGRLFVLCVGLGAYEDETLRLALARKDAEAIADLFRGKTRGLYRETVVTTLLDEQVTKTGLKATLANVASEAAPDDTFVLFLSGHGKTIGQRYYYLPVDFKNDQDDPDAAVRDQGVASDALGEWLAAIPCRNRALLFDTCQSGGALEQVFAFRNFAEDADGASENPRGAYMLAAASAVEDAREVRDLDHGILTYTLLAAAGEVPDGKQLSGHPADADGGPLRVDAWFSYAQEHVPSLYQIYAGQAQDLQTR